uniref:Uncharacterized protein n=1 Tax=Anopheles gambiae TaxID=7165 RepID=A0ABK8G3B4_ANOGA
MANQPGPSKQSSSSTQRDIREVMANIRQHTQKHTLLPRRQSVPTTGSTETAPEPGPSRGTSGAPATSRITTKPGPSKPSNVGPRPGPSTPKTMPSMRNLPTAERNKQLAENSYARELFLKHTNIKEIVAKKMPQRSAKTQQLYAAHCYELYVQQPKMRIREPLHEVRFDTRYHEGLFRMATEMPLTTPQALVEHKQTLAGAGIAQLCFVDMTQRNSALDHQAQVLQKLKADFQHWSSKLQKLPTYILMCQRKRETEDRKFLSLVKHHSSLKGSWTLRQPMVLEDLIEEWRLPSEKRRSMVWGLLRFDDDHLNQRYGVANYSKFPLNVAVEPEEIVEYAVRNIDFRDDGDAAGQQLRPPGMDLAERCITPVNDSSAYRQDTQEAIHEAIELTEEDIKEENITTDAEDGAAVQPVNAPNTENVLQNHQMVAIPAHAVQSANAHSNDLSAVLREPTIRRQSGEVVYTLEYITKHTNIYVRTVQNYMQRNKGKNQSLSLEKIDKYVAKYYNLYRDTFARHQLPEGINFLNPQDQKELSEKGPLVWALGKVEKGQATVPASNNNSLPLELRPPPKPVPVPQPAVRRPSVSQPPRPTSSNEPKTKQQKKDPILRTVVPTRPGCIQYDSDSSINSIENTQPRDQDVLNEAPDAGNNNQSIAFVSIPSNAAPVPSELRPPLSQDSNAPHSQDTPDTLSFVPYASSTQQTQSQQPYDRETVPLLAQEPPPLTQDPLQLSGTTIPPLAAPNPFASCLTPASSNLSPPIAAIRPNAGQTLSQASSVIPPFQVANDQQPAGSSGSTPPNAPLHSFTIKQEALSQVEAHGGDSSGYENDVQILPTPEADIIYVNDSEDLNTVGGTVEVETAAFDPIVARANALFAINRQTVVLDDVFLSCSEITSNSSLEGRGNRAIKEEQLTISPPRIGRYISLEPHRTRHRAPPCIPLATTKVSGPSAHFMLLTHINIQSVRYTKYPTIWPQCNVLQHNPLTVNVNPPCDGIFSVPVRDQHACQLLGLSAGGKGAEALLAALQHAGKFRYGSKEPTKEYYRLTITEKVLQLFFATVPTCPLDGGLVMCLNSRSSLPADGDEVQLERFNYYAHARPPQRSCAGTKARKEEEECLSDYLMPGIAQQMKALREKLLHQAKC